MTNSKLTPVDFNPFEEGKEIDTIAFINEPQKEIWLSCILGGEESNLAYNESVSMDLNGTFYPEYFKEALQEVVSRHEALRSTVSPNGEMLIIYKKHLLNIHAEDLSGSKNQNELLEEFVTAEMLNKFDLKEGPLYRFFLHKLSETNFYFTLVVHHIISDGWSLGVMLEDLSKIYNAKISGKPALLDEAPQISTYADEQVDFNQSENYQLTKRFWLNMYKDNVPVVDLPVDYPRTILRTYKSNRIDHDIPLELVEQLRVTGAKAGCSLVNILLSAFEVFLFLETNQRDVVTGLPVAGQAASGKFGLVGHCVNLLPLRCIIDTENSFDEFLRIRKKAFLDAYEHQNLTFGKLIQSLNIKRDPSRIPLVPVVFNIDSGTSDGVLFDQLDYTLISNPRAYETFEIFLNATRAKSSFTLQWSYNKQLFKDTTIERMAASFNLLLKNLVDNPSITIKELAANHIKPTRDKLKIWNNTAAPYPADTDLSTLINDTALKFPDKKAVTFNGQTLSYKELIDQSNQLAAYFISKNIKNGDIIGVSVERSVEMVVCLLAILKAGATYLPLDPEYPLDRLTYMIADAGTKMLIISEAYTGKYNSGIPEIIVENIWPELASYSASHQETSIKSSDLAYILYTSGSTGRPKGVKISHRNLINFLTSMQGAPGLSPDDKLLSITTISFDIAGLEIYLPLITGAELVVCNTEATKDGRLLLDLIKEKKITVMQATPSTWRMMVDSNWTDKFSLKALCGGEAMPKELAENLLELTTEVWNLYGPTETTVWSAIKKISKEDEKITIGKPIQNTQIYVLNDRYEILPIGVSGEIFIGGDGLSSGYLNQPELTEERFIKDPFSDKAGARLYQTGDLGTFLESGEVVCHGRIDQQVKIRGHRIELGEIEYLLAEQQQVKQAVVVVREDKIDNRRLVAYIVLTDDATKSAYTEEGSLIIPKSLKDEWKSTLRAQLPDYMVPNDFVALKEFPLTPNNKIDKKALPKPVLKTTSSNPFEYGSANEKIISNIWSAVLGIENIGTEDDFFELGGHSLLAVKVMTAIEKQTGKRLPLSVLFENSSIEKLAKKIDGDKVEKWNALVPIRTSGLKPPVFMIHGGGLNVLLYKSLSEYMDEDRPIYAFQALGLNKETPLKDTVEEIASVYIEEMMQVNPNGPYYLLGYSLGGIIAYEMAKQLKSMGKEVKFLAAVDTYAGNMRTLDPPSGLSKKIIRQLNKIPFLIRSFNKYPADTIKYQIFILQKRIKNMFSSEIITEEEHFTAYEKTIYESYSRAHENYIMIPADIKIDLFKVEKRIYFLDDLVSLGWAPFAGKGLKIHVIPGDHATFLKAPYDKEFAHLLQAAIDAN